MLNKSKEHKLQKQVIKKEKETLIFKIKLSFVARQLLKVEKSVWKVKYQLPIKIKNLKNRFYFSTVIDLFEI